MSKDFGANGLKVGVIIAQANSQFVSSLKTVVLYTFTSSIADHIVSEILFDDAWTDEYTELNRKG